jgi:bifunctional oligoribonuclease and PAP phosphatase NrnA
VRTETVAERDVQTRELVLERIRCDTSFVLATHENVDGDAIGSLVAMQGLLTALGKDSLMFIAAGELPLPMEYRFFDLEGGAASKHLIQAPPADIAQRTVVLLDCGNIDRNSAEVLRDGAHLLNIDHHHDNTRFGTLDHVVPEASCTAEIIWDLMHGLGVAPTPAVAQALYVGLVTDTGRFMYENTGPRAHRMAAELIEAGVDVQAVYRRLYEEMPYPKLTLLALALGQVRRFDSGALTLAALSAEDFKRAGAEDSYSEGIVDHLRAVQGTKVAALVRELSAPERRGEHKVSLRAVDDDVDVSAIARAQGGGGHRRAAGFSTTDALDDLIEFLRREIAAQLLADPGRSVAPAPA